MSSVIQTSSSEGNNYKLPSEVLNAALSKINREGWVVLVDDETSEKFLWPPHKPLALESLPHDIYNHKLLVVARYLHGAVSQILSFPDIEETILQNLAIALTSYRHRPEFLAKAVSLIQLDEDGFLHDPYLSPNDPKYQNCEG